MSGVTVADSRWEVEPYFQRRNCKRCTGWKLAVEFRWRWPKIEYKHGRRRKRPVIDTVCIACRNRKERERYHSLSPEEKHAYGQLVNKRAKKRRDQERQLLLRKMRNIKVSSGNANATYGGDPVLPLMPFRLWLITYAKNFETTQQFADAAQVDESVLRRYMDGIIWEGKDDPRPVNGITLGNIDEILYNLGQQHQLPILYPLLDE